MARKRKKELKVQRCLSKVFIKKLDLLIIAIYYYYFLKYCVVVWKMKMMVNAVSKINFAEARRLINKVYFEGSVKIGK